MGLAVLCEGGPTAAACAEGPAVERDARVRQLREGREPCGILY